MKTGRLNFRHHAKTGPGGWHCGCCGIPPNQRKAAAKRMKKRNYRELDKAEIEQM